MAQSQSPMNKRLRRVEADVGELKGAVVQLSQILVELGQRTDAGFNTVFGELAVLKTDVAVLKTGTAELQTGMALVNERLERLLDATLRERTTGAERLADIERRLARLEARST